MTRRNSDQMPTKANPETCRSCSITDHTVFHHLAAHHHRREQQAAAHVNHRVQRWQHLRTATQRRNPSTEHREHSRRSPVICTRPPALPGTTQIQPVAGPDPGPQPACSLPSSCAPPPQDQGLPEPPPPTRASPRPLATSRCQPSPAATVGHTGFARQRHPAAARDRRKGGGVWRRRRLGHARAAPPGTTRALNRPFSL